MASMSNRTCKLGSMCCRDSCTRRHPTGERKQIQPPPSEEFCEQNHITRSHYDPMITLIDCMYSIYLDPTALAESRALAKSAIEFWDLINGCERSKKNDIVLSIIRETFTIANLIRFNILETYHSDYRDAKSRLDRLIVEFDEYSE